MISCFKTLIKANVRLTLRGTQTGSVSKEITFKSDIGLRLIKAGTAISIIPINGLQCAEEHSPNILHIEFHEDIVT
jgi:hypothetical protein